jgi:hypothetical protein
MRKGITAMEVVIAMVFISFLLGLFAEWKRGVDVRIRTETTLKRVQAYQQAIERLYFANLTYVKNNCYGWTDGFCVSISLTPRVINNTTLEVRTWDESVINLFTQIGCRVSGTAPVYDITCYDGWGYPFTLNDENEHTPGTVYTAPYDGRVYVLYVQPSKGQRVAIALDKEFDYSKTQTDQILNTIGNAIVRFVQQKRNAELNNVCDSTGGGSFDPAGGLGSWDDTVIPWVWEIVSQDPTGICSGVEVPTSGCGCSSFADTAFWETDNAYCVVDERGEIQRVLNNLGLSFYYATDGFGNPVVIVPIADANGNPVHCPPPRPRPNYPVLNLGKTTIGIKNELGDWVYRISAVSN